MEPDTTGGNGRLSGRPTRGRANKAADRRAVAIAGGGHRRNELSAPNRERILGAALEEFATKGFDGATTAGVARRAGVTQPLVHYHFESKDELWRAAVGSVTDQLDTTFGGELNELADLSPVDRLKVLVRRFVFFSAAHPQFGRILSYEGATGGERLEWLLRRQSATQLRLFGTLLEEGASSGWIKPLPIEHVASCIGAAAAYVFIMKATMRELYGVDVEAPDTIERHADTVVELFFNGLLATPPQGDEPAGASAGRGAA